MYTTPTTHINSTPPNRAFVEFYYNGVRQRIYNGKLFEINCNPNRTNTLADKKRELARLQTIIHDALKDGWYPGKEKEIIERVPTLSERILTIRDQMPGYGWSDYYLRDMLRITFELNTWLNTYFPLTTADPKPEELAMFLNQYRSSGRYYMNKRRNLSALFKLLGTKPNPAQSTPTMKTFETLNLAYQPDELSKVLTFLKTANPNLYLCALMTYGTLLRPHREIRLLKREDFDGTLEWITIAGKRTKTGRNRRVPVPDFVRAELLSRGTLDLSGDQYIFTQTSQPFNPDYFKTAWSREKNEMLRRRIIKPNQTIYSFRHSAAGDVYKREQNLKLLQGLMGHGSSDATLKYLRTIGSIDPGSKEDMPHSPF